MAYRHHEDHEASVLDGDDDTIIAHAISPQPFEVAGQRASKAARVFGRGDALAQICEHKASRLVTEPAQIARRVGIELDAPHACVAHRCGSARSSRSNSSSVTRSPARARRRWAR